MALAMHIPEGACPVVYACIKSYREAKALCDHNIWEDHTADEEWLELETSARESNPSFVSVLLRAFYAVELMYHCLLPRTFLSSSDAKMHSMFLELHVPRTQVGMKQLRAVADKYERYAEASKVSVVLGGKSANYAQRVDILEKQSKMVQRMSECANVLSRALSGEDKKLYSIGASLGQSLWDGAESGDYIRGQLRGMLTINKENVRYPA